MQSTVASLLLITSAVLLTCVVIDYAVSISEQTLQAQNIPQLDLLKNLENIVRNQTAAMLNQTQSDVPNGNLPQVP